jgi:hypothetical protein
MMPAAATETSTSPSVIAEPVAAAICQRSDAALVGLALHALAREMGDAELEQHIHDCGLLLERAYARFQAHQLPADRDEAVEWLARQQEAILERDRRCGAERHAAFERRISEGVDFFQSDMALAMGRTGRPA